MTRLPRVSWAHLALLAGTLHFLLITGIGLSRHWGYLTSINDLGVFDQAVWGIVNGAPFLNTSNPFGLPINWLGFHFNPILLAFAPFYLIHPAAEWLILFQAVAISITAWPLYVIARQATGSKQAAFLWSLAYLFNPFVLNAAAWDFHPVSLAAPFMALGVLAVERRQAWLFGTACLFLLLIQEHYGAAVAGFGLLWWLRNRSLAPALAALAAGTAHTALVFGLIMPALSPTGSHIMMSGDLGQLSRYGWLGGSLEEIVRNVLFNPLAVARTALTDMGGAKYLGLLLLPLLASPLASIGFLLPALADLAANSLSSNPMPRSLVAYHSISLMPLLVAAGIHGSSRIASIWRRYSALDLAKLVLCASLVSGYLAAPLPLPYAANYWQPRAWPLERESVASEVRRLLPPEASVSAQANIAAHLSQRYLIHPFPTKVGEADFIVLRLETPTLRPAGERPAEIGSLAHHLAVPPEQYLNAVVRVLEGDAYGVVYWNPPWLVFSRENPSSGEVERAVREYLARQEKMFLPEKAHRAGSAQPSD